MSSSSVAPKRQIPMHSLEYFTMCAIGGILSCGLTHTAVTPIDLVKCNAQANPHLFKGAIQGISKIYSGALVSEGYKGGFGGLLRGWVPTLYGYSVQGLFKFGLYEVFEYYYAKAVGDETAHNWRNLLHVASSASAEFIADLGLCPFEAVKVRVQTNPKFANGLFDGMAKLVRQEGFGNLYAGIGPLWARQIPYTVIKFVAFEWIAEQVYGFYKPKSQCSKVEQMGVVFTSGYLAGIFCGAVSHPADTMVSKINKLQSAGGIGEKMRTIYSGSADGTVKGIGFGGLWAGFGPRVFMIGTLTGLQWLIYGAFKGYVGLPLPGKDTAAPNPAGHQKKH